MNETNDHDKSGEHVAQPPVFDGNIPGVCIPWNEAKKRYGDIRGNEEQIKRIWEQNDAEAYDYYWQCLLSF